MRESAFEEVRGEFAKEDSIADIGVWCCRRIKEGHSDLVRLDKLEHPSKEQALQLESTLVVGVGEDVENILHDTEEVLLEERVRN